MKAKHRLGLLVFAGFLVALLAAEFLPSQPQSNPARLSAASAPALIGPDYSRETFTVDLPKVLVIEGRPRRIDACDIWYLQPGADARRMLPPGMHSGYSLDLFDTRSLLIAE
jgi:hypothetical protein